MLATCSLVTVALRLPLEVAMGAASGASVGCVVATVRGWRSGAWSFRESPLFLAMPAALALAYRTFRYPLGWDTRSIWLFHADWFA